MKSLLAFRRYFSNIKYTKSHEWVQYFPEKKVARVGISNFAQEQLGQIVHVQFPAIGKQVAEQQSTVVIESVKVAADVYSPIAGKVSKINQQVSKDPTLVNTKAEVSWLFQLQVNQQPKQLLTAEQYKDIVDKH